MKTEEEAWEYHTRNCPACKKKGKFKNKKISFHKTREYHAFICGYRMGKLEKQFQRKK